METTIEEFRALIVAQDETTQNEPYGGWSEEEKADPEGRDINSHENVISLFPNGDEAVICTSWANDLHRRLGDERVARFGFEAWKNPDALISNLADGHDFAVVDGRFIVDGWVSNVEAIHETGVFDVEDDAALEDIMKIYGDPATWVVNKNDPTANAASDKRDFRGYLSERLSGLSIAPSL